MGDFDFDYSEVRSKGGTGKWIVIILTIAILSGLGLGTYFFLYNNPPIIACTMEAKICPDGSSVGRTGPNCTFAECPNPITNNTCTPSWVLGAWSDCAAGTQTRSVTDANNCNINLGKPTVSRVCDVCVENWICGSWTVCNGGTQTRSCTDSNACGTIASKPEIGKSCTTTCNENWICSSWGTCDMGSQFRTCNDANSCGTTKTKPALSQPCSSGSLNTPFTTPYVSTQCGGVECTGGTGTCDVCLSDCHVCYPNRIRASDYGTYKLYLSSSPSSGIDLERLKEISEVMRRRIYIASEGVLDNFEFYYDPLNPNYNNPNVDVRTMTSAYYFDDDCADIPFFTQGLSFAYWPSHMPWEANDIPMGVTCPISAYSITDDLYGYHDTIHEFGHSVSCGDDTGNIMRCATINGVYLCDWNKFPPQGIDGIEANIKSGGIKLR